MHHEFPVRAIVCGVLAALLMALPAAAEPRITSDLLLPYFEVDLDGARSTLFAVGNASDEPVEARINVRTNWGIRVVGATVEFDPREVKTFNLGKWLVEGQLPGRTLAPSQLAHVQATLTGAPSPDDGLFYSTEVEPDVAVGSVAIFALGNPRPDVLWGDYFWVDGAGDFAEGELLVNVDRTQECPGLCDRHLLRFLEGGAFDGGTEIIVWVDRPSTPQPSQEPVLTNMTISGSSFYDEQGNKFDERMIDLLATQAIPVADLLLSEQFGWLQMITEEQVYVGVRYKADDRFGVTLQSWCIEEPPPPPRRRQRPALDIEKLTDGFDADQPPGPALQIGAIVTWEYLVTNTGNVRLQGVGVSDNQGVAVTCPRSSLSPGASMTCTGSGTVQAGPYSNVGTVIGTPPDGPQVSDNDPSHYNGVEIGLPGEPRIDIEKLTNGQNADTPPGPFVTKGDPITWTYVVTNTGGLDLTNVQVSDDQEGAITCPESSLAVGGSMICTASGTAEEGQYSNLGSVSAQSAGGSVSDTDPSHYFGQTEIVVEEPDIRIEKSTNGVDADSVAAAPQLTQGDPVTWTYVVTNTGNTTLTDIDVSDDQGEEVSCPKTTLDAGEQMTCQASGTAIASDDCYCNVGIVVGTPPEGSNVTDSDPSHYCAEETDGAAIAIEKATNGVDADTPTGPVVIVGSTVNWTYEVTNVGNVTLNNVTVSDSEGVSVSCSPAQGSSLAPGAVMTCQASGVATEGQYSNVGTATGEPEGGGDDVQDTDSSHYLGEVPLVPGITIQKSTNGEDADSAPGPTITVGDPVTWTYVVTNNGELPLTNVSVTDDELGPITCPKSTLAIGESMTCTANGTAEADQYDNVGTVTASSTNGGVDDTDPSHYFGEVPEECAECEGKIDYLKLQYDGTSSAQIRVEADFPGSDPVVFDDTVAAGGVFELFGVPSTQGGFNLTLGTNITLFVDGVLNTEIHTSCSDPLVGPGFTSGSFTVLEGTSKNAGPLCPSGTFTE